MDVIWVGSAYVDYSARPGFHLLDEELFGWMHPLLTEIRPEDRTIRPDIPRRGSRRVMFGYYYPLRPLCDDRVIESMLTRKLKPAIDIEALAFSMSYSGELKTRMVAALGTTYRLEGRSHSLFMCRDSGKIGLHLLWTSKDCPWDTNCRFLICD